MSISLSIPRLTYGRIGDIAYSFLKGQGHSDSIPVPIEEIIELNLKLHIIPVQGLQDGFGAVAFTTGDFEAIEVDQFVQMNRSKRYRYTIAHELGHIILHKDVFEQAKVHYSSIQEWAQFYVALDNEQQQWLEWQAYCFGALVLVPVNHLDRIFKERIQDYQLQFRMAKENKVPKTVYSEYFINQTASELSSIFDVSEEVIHRRIDKDGLKKIIP
jgi:Zn-dependent peptidase ImmA (M78 family)